ncbi:hypothetical protein Btru_064278 [Bulinus truncatus]|nr:hypothetical protein Btru_064278 [Bulinus truncatus]
MRRSTIDPGSISRDSRVKDFIAKSLIPTTEGISENVTIGKFSWAPHKKGYLRMLQLNFVVEGLGLTDEPGGLKAVKVELKERVIQFRFLVQTCSIIFILFLILFLPPSLSGQRRTGSSSAPPCPSVSYLWL